ncbi:retrotransposon protein, putative, ty1-copia subclass, partial [Tanacetum coccineum]
NASYTLYCIQHWRLQLSQPFYQHRLHGLSAKNRKENSCFIMQASRTKTEMAKNLKFLAKEEGKPVASYVIQMKGYVDQLERLGYMLPQDLIVGLILNGLTKDFAGFVRNYNMHNMGKTIGGKIQKAKKKSLKAKGKGKANGKENDKQVYIPKPKNPKPSAKEHPAKDDACHHCKEIVHRWFGKWICPACFADFRILVSKNNVQYFNVIPSNVIYEIDMHDLVPNNNSIYNVSTKRAKHNLDSTYLWHYRLAHISKKSIEKMQQEGLLRSTDDESFDQCVSCLLGKTTRKLFPHLPEMATDLLGIIHTNVCGPLRHVPRQGASYFITFADDYSHYGYVYLPKHKHEVFETFKHLTPPYTPQHNGVSERRNHTLLNMVQSMMNLTTLSLSFWDYALESATHILNMVPTKKVDKTPYELWYGKVPNLSYLKVWGCEALVKRDMPDKLQQRSIKCIFIGYPKEIMGYYFYFPPKNKIVVARYAEFFEKNLITEEVSGRAKGLKEIQDKDTSPSKITSEIPMEVEGFEPPQEEVILIRRSERTHRAPEGLCLNLKVEEHSLGDLNEPTSYKATMLDPKSDKWIDAMNAEMQSMIDNMV